MNKNETLKSNRPLIFNKKINKSIKIIPLNLTVNTSGPIKHFPPATIEWFNSIYAYNKNSVKNLSIADKILSKLLKSYFNFYFNKKVIKSRYIAMRFRRLLVKKIFVSKAEIKHTSSRVIITLYVYNEEKIILRKKIKELTTIIFPSKKELFIKSPLEKSISMDFLDKKHWIWFQYYKTPLLKWISNNAVNYFKQLILERDKFSSLNNRNLLKLNILNRENLLKGLEQWIDISRLSVKQHTNYTMLENFYLKYLRLIFLSKEYKVIRYYKVLLRLNKAKFEDFFILRLRPLVQSIYNKEIVFNIVNLKTLFFNSDLFTQVVSLKLKNRNNRLIRVLRSALFLVKLPRNNITRALHYKTSIKQLWGNKVKNIKINELNSIITTNKNKDLANTMLLKLFSNSSFITSNVLSVKPNLSLLNYILNSLKHKNMYGVRLEAKGRLTRRFTAERSVFKIKWKGGIKNIDSAYRGLSTVMLRGHLNSNVQYTLNTSKTRNGAFGIKGWLGTK